jgi:GntR family transcriptional regulator of arabinose operon
MSDYQVSELPKYELVRRQLLHEIESGRHAPGSPFPSERVLLQQFGVSRPTLVRSLRELVREGYLVRKRGKGTFVAHRQQIAQAPNSATYAVFISRETANLSGARREVQLRILRGIQAALGDSLDFASVQQATSHSIEPQTRRFIESRAAGSALVIEPSFCPSLLHLLAEHGWQIWTINEPASDFNCARIDHQHAGYLATRYLLDRGRTRIAMLNGPEKSYWGFEARRLGYETALQEAGIQIDPELILEDDHPIDSEAGRAMIRRLLEHQIRFDGVVGASDPKAMGAMACASEHGLRVPEDVAFVGIDNTFAIQAGTPLPAVAMPFEEMGYQAAFHAKAAAENTRFGQEHVRMEIILKPALVER